MGERSNPSPGTGSGGDETGLLTGASNEGIAGLRERERIEDTFGRYMSKEVTEYLLQGEVRLGGETRDVSILIARDCLLSILWQKAGHRRISLIF